jgi:hypothetical protein
MRTREFLASFERLGVATDVITPDRPLGAFTNPVTAPTSAAVRLRSKLGQVKRQFLPMPTLSGARDAALAKRIASSDSDLHVFGAFSQVQYSSRTESAVWIDFMDVWSEFARREAAVRRGPAKVTALAQSRVLRSQEARFAKRAHIVTAAGYADVEILRRQGIRAVWLPTWLPDATFEVATNRPGNRTAGFLGNFEFWPNRDAYDALLRHWREPLLRDGWRIIVAGRHSESLPQADGVDIIGAVDSVKDFYQQIDVALAPIRLGGGIKVKLVEAMAYGVPLVTTQFALEGFPPAVVDHATIWEFGAPMPVVVKKGDLPLPKADALTPFRVATADRTVRDLLERVTS